MCKISVIIPVYNAEKWIKNCVDSLSVQSLKEFEIILVDDGSKDNSYQICKNLEKENNNIIAITKENGGAASARNLGLLHATGEFISFVDSDDTVSPDFLFSLYSASLKHNADIVMCDYVKYTNTGKYEFSQRIRGGYYSKYNIQNELFPCLIMYENLELPPTISNCVCLFKRSFLYENNIKYPDVNLCEDSFFGSVCLFNANNFVYLKGQYLYNYLYHETSVSHSFAFQSANVRWQSLIKINKLYTDYFYNCNYNFSMQIKYNMLYFTLNQLILINSSKLSFFKHKNEVLNILNNDNVKKAFEGLKYPKVPLKLKICIFMLKHRMATLYCATHRK